MTSAAIVQKLWNFCNVLRDDGMSYEDLQGALEQLKLIAEDMGEGNVVV